MDNDSAGFTSPDEDDQRGWLWVVTILSIIYSLAFFGARVFVKYGQLGRDDLILGIAYIIAFARWGAIMNAFTLGLGAFLGSTVHFAMVASTLAQLAHWSRILLLISHWLAKGSVAIFTRRLFSGDMNHEKPIFAVAIAATGTSGLAAVLIASVRCSAVSLVEGNGANGCSGLGTRWIIVCVLDIVSELVLLALPVVLLIPVHFDMAKKRKVWLYYSFRIGVIIFSIAHTITFLEFARHGRPSIGFSRPLILSELLLCYTLVSASIPCMRTFVGAFAGHSLMLPGEATTTRGSYVHDETYHLRTIGSTKKARAAPKADDASDQEQLNLRPGSPMYNVSVEHGQGTRSSEQLSTRSAGSDQMIIRRDLHVYIDREEK